MSVLSPREVAAYADSACNAMAKHWPELAQSKMWRRVLVSIAKTESNNNTMAMSRISSARGLMQILKGTQADIERRLSLKPKSNSALDDPAYSMLLAAYYVAWLWKYKGSKNWDRTIIAYNQGHYNTSPAGSKYRQAVWASYQKTPWQTTNPYA